VRLSSDLGPVHAGLQDNFALRQDDRMRNDVADVVERLLESRDPRLLQLIDDALPADTATRPDSDVVEPYHWFLRRVGDGLRLTAAGHLPPAVVSEIMRSLGWDADWIGAGNREDLTVPVSDLHASARRLGLVRVHRGVLLQSVAGRRLTEDPAGLWQHIAARIPLGRRDVEVQAGVLWLLATAAERPDREHLVGLGLRALGWGRRDGGPPDAADARALVRETRTVFDRLGLLTRGRRPGNTAAAVALARAALLGGEGGVPLPLASKTRDGVAIELTVTLTDVHPPVWRRIVVPGSLTMRELHAVLQTAMGWEDAHLHLFRVRNVLFGDIEDFSGELGDEEATTVSDVARIATEFSYEYDFGDGWEHTIQVGQRLPTVGLGTPHCLDGARACPPEDCGGAPGYERLVEVLADPAGPEHAELTEWLGGEFDPEAFDRDATNELLELYDRHTRQRRRT
jgi:hypothetical protein